MRNWLSPAIVTGRILLALGLALLLGAVVGSLVGVKTSIHLNGTMLLRQDEALVISTYTLTSKGYVEVEAWNASRVYYVSGIRGDPRSLLKGLQAFNISVGEENFKTDFRLGVAYGVSTVRAGHGILEALPALSKSLRFQIVDLEPIDDGHYKVRIPVDVNEAIMVFVLGKNVTYSYTYSVGAKNIADPLEVAVFGVMLAAGGSMLILLWPAQEGRER